MELLQPDHTEPDHERPLAAVEQLALTASDVIELEQDAHRGWQRADELDQESRDRAAQLAAYQLQVQTLSSQLELAREAASDWEATARGVERVSSERNRRLKAINGAIEGLTQDLAEQSQVTAMSLAEIEERWQRSEDQRFAAVEQCALLERQLADAEERVRVADAALEESRQKCHAIERYSAKVEERAGETIRILKAEVVRLDQVRASRLRTFRRGMRIMGSRIERLEGQLATAELTTEAQENWNLTLNTWGHDALVAMAPEGQKNAAELVSALETVEGLLLKGWSSMLLNVPGSGENRWISARIRQPLTEVEQIAGAGIAALEALVSRDEDTLGLQIAQVEEHLLGLTHGFPGRWSEVEQDDWMSSRVTRLEERLTEQEAQVEPSHCSDCGADQKAGKRIRQPSCRYCGKPATPGRLDECIDCWREQHQAHQSSQPNFTGDSQAGRSEDRPNHCTGEHSRALRDQRSARRAKRVRKSQESSSRMHLGSRSAEGRTCDGGLPNACSKPVTGDESETSCQNMAKRLESGAPGRLFSPWVDRLLDGISRLADLDKDQELALRVLVKRPGKGGR